MFIDSEQLKSMIQSISDEIAIKSNGKITFEEYISLPYYGYIILRFNLNAEQYTIEDLDSYEAMMYDCVKDEFLIDFMGEVYRNIGIDYKKMDKLFADCFHFYEHEDLAKSSHAEEIKTMQSNYLNCVASLPIFLFGKFRWKTKFIYCYLVTVMNLWDSISMREQP